MFTLTSTALMTSILACNGGGLSTSSPPAPAPIPTAVTPVGTISNGGFYASAVVPSGQSYYFHEQSSLTGSCKIAQGESNFAKQDLYCIVDMEELNLYFYGATINFNAPPSMCDYTGMMGYAFYAYQPGSVGGVTLTVHKDNTGAIIGTTSSNPKVTLDATGKPVCAYDYSVFTPVAGPNCCEGSWSLTVNQDAVPPATTGTSMTSTGSFGGKMSACLAGPAMQGTVDKAGYPEEKIYRTKDQGQNFAYTIAAPLQQQNATNLMIANYFSPTDYGAASDNFSMSMTASDYAPPLVANPATPNEVFPLGLNYPYYRYTCYDAALEIQARISILIRSWDTVAGFTADNNPYTAGSETNWGTLKSDFETWHSIDVLFGPSTFPGSGI